MTQITSASDTSSLFRNINTAYRIDKLHNALHPDSNYISQEVKNIWVNAAEQLSKKTFTSFEETKTKLRFLPPKIESFYLNSIEQNNEKLLAFAKEALVNIPKELESILAKDPSGLSMKPPEEISASLQGIWQEVIDKLETNTFASFEDTRTKLKPLPSKVADIYRNLINKNSNDPIVYVKGTFNLIEKDLGSILSKNPTALSIDGSEDLPEKTVESLLGIWKEVVKRVPEPFAYEETISYIHAQLEQFPLAIQEIYKTDLQFASTLENVKAYASRYFKETRAAHYHCIQATSEGKAGYPKIIHYAINKSDGSKENFTGFFKHFSHPIEMDYHLFYKELLNGCLSNDELSSLFNVPKAVMLDLKASNITDTSGIRSPIDPITKERLQTIFTHFATTHTKRNFGFNDEMNFQKQIQERPIGLFETIQDPNFSNFFQLKYTELSADQKELFLEKLGMIALVDLLGNRDRLVNTDLDLDGEKYVLFGTNDPLKEDDFIIESNLGNLMIGANTMHVIDNSLGDGTRPETWISNTSDRELYLSFLEDLFSKEDPEKAIACHFLHSLRKAITNLGEDEGDRKAIQENSLHLLEELDRMDLTPFILGMQKMKAILYSTVIPKWNSPESFDLKTKLHPDLVSMVEERLALFSKFKRTSLDQTETDKKTNLIEAPL